MTTFTFTPSNLIENLNGSLIDNPTANGMDVLAEYGFVPWYRDGQDAYRFYLSGTTDVLMEHASSKYPIVYSFVREKGADTRDTCHIGETARKVSADCSDFNVKSELRMLSIDVRMPPNANPMDISPRNRVYADALFGAYRLVTNGYPSMRDTWNLLRGVDAGTIDEATALSLWSFSHAGEEEEGWTPGFDSNTVTSSNGRLCVFLLFDTIFAETTGFRAEWASGTSHHLLPLIDVKEDRIDLHPDLAGMDVLIEMWDGSKYEWTCDIPTEEVEVDGCRITTERSVEQDVLETYAVRLNQHGMTEGRVLRTCGFHNGYRIAKGDLGDEGSVFINDRGVVIPLLTILGIDEE